MKGTEIRELPADLVELAKQEVNEVPERRADDIAHIKRWLAKQAHLDANTDDQWILTFLRGCKFSLERTKEKLDAYYTVRALIPDFFTNRDPLLPEIQELLDLGVAFPLPKPDKLGRTIFFLRVGGYDPARMKIESLYKLHFINMDIVLRDFDRPFIAGDVTLLDCEGATMAHIAQVSPAALKKVATVYQEAYPCRAQSINYFNTKPAFDTIFRLLRSFLKEKLQKRLFIHGEDRESLYKQVPRECLPYEYGGQAGSVKDLAAQWKAKVESCRAWLLEDETRKSNERKRPGRPKTQEVMFGMEGSFRTLAVD